MHISKALKLQIPTLDPKPRYSLKGESKSSGGGLQAYAFARGVSSTDLLVVVVAGGGGGGGGSSVRPASISSSSQTATAAEAAA